MAELMYIGGNPRFGMDAKNYMGGNDACMVSAQKSLLQKPVNYYYDWVYMGKEAYGTKHWNRAAIKPGTKFFDVLGKAYDKMKAKIKYYIFKDAIDKKEYDVAMEFEVWARIVKDEEGNDIQVFIKKDDKHGFRKDSSFYYNGYWEVFEFDDAANETRFRASSGIRSLRKYDGRKRMKELYRIDGNGDTLASEQYEWKNGRLVRMTANGVARSYIYGKTLQDTVRVVPSDEGFNYHRGYNGTAGKIPEEDTPGYETFSRNPYGHVHLGEMEEEALVEDFVSENFAFKKSSGSLNVLGKIVTQGCVDEEADMPKAQCIRHEISDSKEKNGLYGHSDFKLSISHECKCNAFGKYQPSFNGRTVNEEIEVYQSVWIYNFLEEYLYERCWGSADLQATYAHEVKHIKNGRHKAKNIGTFALTIIYDKKEQCEKYVKEGKEYKILLEKWNEWYEMEQKHKNPESPIVSGGRHEYSCN